MGANHRWRHLLEKANRAARGQILVQLSWEHPAEHQKGPIRDDPEALSCGHGHHQRPAEERARQPEAQPEGKWCVQAEHHREQAHPHQRDGANREPKRTNVNAEIGIDGPGHTNAAHSRTSGAGSAPPSRIRGRLRLGAALGRTARSLWPRARDGVIEGGPCDRGHLETARACGVTVDGQAQTAHGQVHARGAAPLPPSAPQAAPWAASVPRSPRR